MGNAMLFYLFVVGKHVYFLPMFAKLHFFVLLKIVKIVTIYCINVCLTSASATSYCTIPSLSLCKIGMIIVYIYFISMQYCAP